MLQNAYFLAKIGADTAKNERTFSDNLPKIGSLRVDKQEAKAESEKAKIGKELAEVYSGVSDEVRRDVVERTLFVDECDWLAVATE